MKFQETSYATLVKVTVSGVSICADKALPIYQVSWVNGLLDRKDMERKISDHETNDLHMKACDFGEKENH